MFLVGKQASPRLPGIFTGSPWRPTRNCPCSAELASVQRKWAIKLAPFEHRTNGFSNEPEDALETSWGSDSLRGYIKAKTGDWRIQMLRNHIPQRDLWVTESELLLLLKTSISLNCLAGWDQALCTFSHIPRSTLAAEMANKFLHKSTKLLQLPLKWEDKFEINLQKSLIYQQYPHDYFT